MTGNIGGILGSNIKTSVWDSVFSNIENDIYEYVTEPNIELIEQRVDCPVLYNGIVPIQEFIDIKLESYDFK